MRCMNPLGNKLRGKMTDNPLVCGENAVYEPCGYRLFHRDEKGRIPTDDTLDRATVDRCSDAHSLAESFGNESDTLNLCV